MFSYLKYIIIIFVCIFFFSCSETKEDHNFSVFSETFDNEVAEEQSIIFRGRIDELKTENFDFQVETPSDYEFTIQKPLHEIKLLVVNKTNLQIVNKIDNNQTIHLDKGDYNLVVTYQTKDLKPTEVVFEVVKVKP